MGVTVMVTVEVFEDVVPSFARNVKLSAPWKLPAGRYVNAPLAGSFDDHRSVQRRHHQAERDRVAIGIARDQGARDAVSSAVEIALFCATGTVGGP
jgi:hypothetical protein